MWLPSRCGTALELSTDIAKNRAEAREIMTRLGYGPDKRLAIKVAARNIAGYRDPAIILIDQLKQIGIDGELDPIETANWFPKLAARTTRSASTTPAVVWTPTSNSSRITAAARSATTPTIATRSSNQSHPRCSRLRCAAVTASGSTSRPCRS